MCMLEGREKDMQHVIPPICMTLMLEMAAGMEVEGIQ